MILLMYWRTGEFSPFLYRGGFVVLSVATVLAVAAMAHPASRLGPLVGNPPMRWIGERSYGIYLWHFPVIVLTSHRGVAAGQSLLESTCSRSRRSSASPSSPGATSRTRSATAPWAGSGASGDAGDGAARRSRRRAWAVIGVGGLVVAIAIAGLLGVGVSSPSHASGKTVAKTVKSTKQQELDEHTTLCEAVVHIGDSTSEGLVSTEYVEPDQLISAQYARVGVTESHLEVSGGAFDLRAVRRASPTPRKSPKPGRTKASKAAGCWRSAPTRRPTSPPARPSATTTGSKR